MAKVKHDVKPKPENKKTKYKKRMQDEFISKIKCN